jgi:mannose-6-phosphate isomerase-like protein (cupin superfamily)
MTKQYRWSLLAVFVTAVLYAQVPAGERIDNERVRVFVANEQPHHPGAQHEHKVNRVMIYLGDGEMTFKTPAGKVDKLKVKKGDVLWSPATGPHVSENITDHAFQIVEVELKGKPQHRAVPESKLDPLKVDPKHYTLVFENDQVRVLRVRFGAKEKGVLHEHTLDHLVVYMNDQARGKTGEVRLDGVMTHTEENPLDHPVERIAIDLK